MRDSNGALWLAESNRVENIYVYHVIPCLGTFSPSYWVWYGRKTKQYEGGYGWHRHWPIRVQRQQGVYGQGQGGGHTSTALLGVSWGMLLQKKNLERDWNPCNEMLSEVLAFFFFLLMLQILISQNCGSSYSLLKWKDNVTDRKKKVN